VTKKRALGRGLDALLGMTAGPASAADAGAAAAPAAAGDQLRMLPVDLIQRGRYQPRLDIKPEALQELADSIKAQGVVQPVVVRPLPGGSRFELIAGERRWRATQLAGLQDIPAIVKDVSDRTVMSIALIENIQREQLNPLEEALALQRLITEFEMTHQEVSEAVGRSRAAVSNLLRLLDLAPTPKRLLEQGLLEMGHARALLSLAPAAQNELAERVAAEGLSVRATEKLVRSYAEGAARKMTTAPVRSDPNIQHLEGQLADRLGAAVSIQHRAKGDGKLVICYGSLEELDGILAHIR
jgi:ParB family chromosome partitioning protein